MYLSTFLPSVALFFLAASSAVNATSKDTLGAHQIIARSNSLSLRQTTGDYGACTYICEPLESKIMACGNSDACACSSEMYTPFHDCMECGYQQTTSASSKAELLEAYNEYLDACKDFGYPIQGDTSIAGAETVQRSSSSSASATAAASSSTASTKSASNGANALKSGLVSGVALPLAAIAVSALVL